ncbi:hypothetical protein Tco_0798860 [Tanacetum coccineum]
MGDENPCRTLGDYSRPSHEGYRNTIEVPNGNDLPPLRSDTIRLVQNGCSFHELRSKDPNQHLKDFLKIVDSIDLNVETRERIEPRNKEVIKSPTKLLVPKYHEQPSSVTIDEKTPPPRRVQFVNTTTLVKKERESRDTTPKEHEGLTSEVDDEVGSNELEEEEEDGLEYFNTFPSMKELKYHERPIIVIDFLSQRARVSALAGCDTKGVVKLLVKSSQPADRVLPLLLNRLLLLRIPT